MKYALHFGLAMGVFLGGVRFGLDRNWWALAVTGCILLVILSTSRLVATPEYFDLQAKVIADKRRRKKQRKARRTTGKSHPWQ